MPIRTRIAPTPSGYLHAGNAWSFLLTWLSARRQGGSIRLRIDDLDAARMRGEYVEDIFASLEWLGLDWDTGPRTPAEAETIHSQRLRIPRYREALERLAALSAAGPQAPASPMGPGPLGAEAASPLLYACSCSRGKVKRDALNAGRPGLYPGTCRDAGIEWRRNFDARHPSQESYPLRLHVPGSAEAAITGAAGEAFTLHPGRDIGDFVVWQRNGEPAYQLASLVDDEEFGTDLIVRGKDLLPSSGAQAWMAGLLGFKTFQGARFLHHDLLVDARGGKLSKSEGAISLRGLRARLGGPGPLLAFFARKLGIQAASPARAADLLTGFEPARIPEGPLFWADLAREAGIG
jgi:glutamyl-tRNA synthetase